jgi:hypothetical protein
MERTNYFDPPPRTLARIVMRTGTSVEFDSEFGIGTMTDQVSLDPEAVAAMSDEDVELLLLDRLGRG